MNLGSLFFHHSLYRPDHLAVVFEDQRLTWLEFNRQINRLANALINLGIQKGDKVTTILPNCLELLEIYWAIAKIGAVVVPASTLLLEPAMKTLLQDSDSVMLILSSARALPRTCQQIRAAGNRRGSLYPGRRIRPRRVSGLPCAQVSLKRPGARRCCHQPG